jgi:hypothetical protein
MLRLIIKKRMNGHARRVLEASEGLPHTNNFNALA